MFHLNPICLTLFNPIIPMLSHTQIKSFLKFIWTRRLYHDAGLQTRDGRPVQVIATGAADPSGEMDIVNAHILLGGTHCMGHVAFGQKASDFYLFTPRITPGHDSLILLVVEVADTVLCRTDGSVIPTLEITYPEPLGVRYREIIDRSNRFGCAEYFATMKPILQYEILTRLTVERLERKHNDFMKVYGEVENNWNETFYIMLFRAMSTGSEQNRTAYMKLARNVPYSILCRIRESLFSVEALLLGAAGLLEARYVDDYTIELQREFAYLSRRFGITPMWPREWVYSGSSPNNHPVIRLVELAALLASEEFLFSRLVDCVTPDDLRVILTAEASEYWTSHYLPGRRSGNHAPKQIGSVMKDILGINLVVPLMFAYGTATQNQHLRERATDLLEMIPPENNGYIRKWRTQGIQIENAFFSQGLLQLSKEYCEKKRCAECNIGKILLCSQ